ncbi:23S rRNA (pseudouridine(1915)-N(3))-methyltransferase RlmH [Desulfitobacterium metallireducens]|uniref:23S rRNA (pseudouridine(1915)-N(3))-methyltransferase RlmH n=1 Tax=Desulfitobacterium metallireducens TaxID=142877 RepID=UPI003D035E02
MQAKAIAVGKVKEKYLQDGIKEYTKRLSSYLRLDIIEVADEPCPEKLSAAEEDRVREKEGERILKVLNPQDYVVLLDLKGKELTSPELANFIDELALHGRSNIAWVIGGSLGVADEVRERADFRWSFSKLTFPHQLMRMMLLEQVYRAMKISKGEPYHK